MVFVVGAQTTNEATLPIPLPAVQAVTTKYYPRNDEILLNHEYLLPDNYRLYGIVTQHNFPKYTQDLRKKYMTVHVHV